MRIFNNTIISKNYKGSAIAIGNFDGMHKGHQKVFEKTKKFAKENKIKFGVMTFTPLPIMFFNKKIKNYRLVSENQKLKLFIKVYSKPYIQQYQLDNLEREQFQVGKHLLQLMRENLLSRPWTGQ